MFRLPIWLATCGALAGMLAGCGSEPGPTRLGEGPIPAEHRLAPGSCQVWTPYRHQSEQPPPQPCDTLEYRAPPGSFMLRR